MGMGAYDEDDQERKEPDFDEEDEGEVITLQDERRNGEVKSETPDDINKMMDNFREESQEE